MIIRRIETNRIEIVDEHGNAFIPTVPENYATPEAWLQSWLEAYTAYVQVGLQIQVEELEDELLNTQERAADLERQLEEK